MAGLQHCNETDRFVLRLELERVSQEVHHLNEEGREAFNSGNPDTAISLSETAIRLIQDSPHLLPFLTEEHAVASRNIDKALLDLEKISQEACQLNNDSFEALKSGETRRAISLCKKAMTLMHKSPYFLSEQCEIVRRNLDAAYNLHDELRPCRLIEDGNQALMSRDPDKAISLYKDAIQLMQDSPHFQSEHRAVVGRNLDRAYSLRDEVEPMRLNEAGCKALESGDPEKAIRLYENAMSLMQNSPHIQPETLSVVRRNLDQAYRLHNVSQGHRLNADGNRAIASGEYKRAIYLFEKAMRLMQDNPDHFLPEHHATVRRNLNESYRRGNYSYVFDYDYMPRTNREPATPQESNLFWAIISAIAAFFTSLFVSEENVRSAENVKSEENGRSEERQSENVQSAVRGDHILESLELEECGFKFMYRNWQHRPFLRNPHRQQLNDHPSDSMARSVEGHYQALTSSSDSQHMNSLLAVGTLEDDRTRHAGFSSQLNDHASRQMGRPVEEQRPVQGQSTNKRRGKTKPRKKPVIPQCKECEQRLSAARRHFHHGTKTVMAHSALQDIFRCSHEKNCANEGFELKAVELIMEQLSRSNTTDFPTFLWDLPNRLHQVLDRLIRDKNWNQVCVVMKKAQEDNASSVKQRAVAAKIPVKDLVGTDDGKEYSRCEILAFILTCGARGSTQSEYVSHLGTALRHREFLIAEELFRFVEDPPLHVAFHMALEKGDFSLFHELLGLYRREPLQYQVLAPDMVDKHGHTLFQLAMSAQLTKQSVKAVHILLSQRLVSFSQNPALLSLDSIKSCRDERALYLIKAFIKELRGFTVEEATRAEASVEKWSEVKDHDAETEGGRRGTVVRESRETATGEAQQEKGEETTDTEIDLSQLEWEVECTADVQKTLKRLTSDLRLRAMKCIERLANGERSKMLSKPVSKGLELFEAKLSKGERIVWEQAVAFSPRLSTTENYIYAEVIRVWDIVLDHKKIHASVQRIRNSHKRGQCSVIKKHLKLETHTAGHGTSSERTIHPKTYSEVETGGDKKQVDVTTTEQLQLYLPAMDEETQFQIHKFYSVSSLLDSVLENTDVQIEWPLRATAVEHAVISLPQDSPVLLLGRSGTGKTTCCLYRLWNSFLRCCKASDLVDDQDVRLQLHPHQLFVTKNPVLCIEVQKNFHGLCLGNAAVRSRVAMMNASIPHRLQDIHGHQYPLFLTSKQLILMLDASLPKPHFFDRDDNGRLLQEVAGYNEATDMFAPYTPLDEVKGKVSMSSASKEKKSKKVEARVEVSDHMFATRIWPEIKHKVELGKDCHPSLVWLEIMSFIKGSFEALETTLGYLSREEYERIGRKRAPSFTGNRDDVYRLFELYNTYKKGHRLYDEADLLFNIYQRLKAAEPRLQWELHEIYVDETQDFTQAELSLLVKLADNPNHMFLAGDTAQCIMQGVSFRFEDLKTLFYYAKRDSPKTQDKRSVITVPRVHQLKFNYRSHRGILNLASAIVDLLVDFFPESFDRLERDQGFLDGPKPVLLDISNCDMNDLTLLLTGDKQRTSHIEFGAHQAILVANDEAREKVPEELRQGIILTIYEAKGLEFDDVLLYNFFQDSQADDEWRVVMDYLKRHPVNIPDTSDSSSNTSEAFLSRAHSRPLPFDPKLHKILNSELKQLYTAVTRARVNVWFFDEKTSPMLYYCHALGLMDVKEVDISEGAGSDSGSGMYAKKSSPSEWETQGDMFMSQQLYKVAAKCFQNAGADHKRRIAQVHDRLLEAFKMADEPRDAKCTAYLRAAILLLQCAYELSDRPSAQVTQYNLLAKAAKSLQTARVRLQAAQIFEKICKFEEAAKLYSDAGEASKAAQCWEKLRN